MRPIIATAGRNNRTSNETTQMKNDDAQKEKTFNMNRSRFLAMQCKVND